MKAHIFGFVFILLSSLSFANPNPDPQVYLSEVKIYSSSNWSIELAWFYIEGYEIDSIYLQSNTGSVKVTCGNTVLITPPDVSAPFFINPQGDVIAVTVWVGEGYLILSAGVRFGNVDDPWVLEPASGHSIARPLHEYDYYVMSLDKSPTIGWIQDSTGMCCTLSGTVYDMNGNKVVNHWFKLDFPFITGPNGEYKTRICSRIHTWNKIYMSWYKTGDITPFSYALRPDSTVYEDIHLLDSLIAGSQDIGKPVSAIKIFPNPVHDRLNVALNVDLAQPVFDYTLSVLDISGRIIHKEVLTSAIGIISVPVDLKSGQYLVRLEGDGRLIDTQRFIVL